MATSITSRDDLPFVTHHRGAVVDWRPQRCLTSPETAVQRGLGYVDAIAARARVDEYAAWEAAKAAVLSEHWNRDGGEEEGFVDGLCRAAVIGWRAQAQTAPLPFEARFDPRTAQWLALQRRVELMEAQLKAMKVRPWRTYAEAGWE